MIIKLLADFGTKSIYTLGTTKSVLPNNNTVDREFFLFFIDDLFRRKLNTQNILCNVCRPIPILVTKVWQRNLDYIKNLQAKYFMPGYRYNNHNIMYVHYPCCSCSELVCSLFSLRERKMVSAFSL